MGDCTAERRKVLNERGADNALAIHLSHLARPHKPQHVAAAYLRTRRFRLPAANKLSHDHSAQGFIIPARTVGWQPYSQTQTSCSSDVAAVEQDTNRRDVGVR